MVFQYGLPDCLFNQLQRVQNTAARLVLCIRKSAHITPVLMKLHWLPVQHRVYIQNSDASV